MAVGRGAAASPRLREKPVEAEALENVKGAIAAGFALSLESVNGVLSQRMQACEYGLAEDYWDTYPEKVMAVTAADVQLIAVSDGSKVAGVLGKYGPVEQARRHGLPAGRERVLARIRSGVAERQARFMCCRRRPEWFDWEARCGYLR